MKPEMKNRMRRSMLFVPGANAAMVSNAFIYQSDALMFDLEDSVILREKDAARRLVYHALQHPLYQDVETIVRVNALDSAYGLADLEAVVRGGTDIVRLPKPITRKMLKIWHVKSAVLNRNVAVNWVAPACWPPLNQHKASLKRWLLRRHHRV